MSDDGDGWIDYERTMWVGMFSLLFYCFYTYTFPFFIHFSFLYIVSLLRSDSGDNNDSPRKPTTANAGLRRPITANTCQRGPTQADVGWRGPGEDKQKAAAAGARGVSRVEPLACFFFYFRLLYILYITNLHLFRLQHRPTKANLNASQRSPFGINRIWMPRTLAR